jgi:hypothetical protein
MARMPSLNSVLTWLRRYERHLSGVVFLLGFIGDLFTFALTDLPVANLVFLGYLASAAIGTFLTHTISSRFDTHDALWRRVLSVVAPLMAQFAIGSLLSGSLIFYTKSAALDASWPFLVLLLLIFLGNEILRDHRAHLAFQTILFFFSLYSYSIFALPLVVGRLGPTIFLESTGITVLAFGLFLGGLAAVSWTRTKETLLLILLGTAAVLILITTSYFTSVIPPIPLTLRDSGIYHQIQRTSTGYTLLGEVARPWWQFYQSRVVHVVPGEPIYAFSSVFAPGAFSANVIHKWEWYDEANKKWITQSTIPFTLAGGRAGGYRGYSEISNVSIGKWRVYIETTDGQTIGRIYFTVVSTPVGPELKTETK